MPEVEVRASKKYNQKLVKELREAVEDILQGRTVGLEELLKKIGEGR